MELCEKILIKLEEIYRWIFETLDKIILLIRELL